MKWQGGRKGGNIEDRRGMSTGAAVGGGGIGVIIIALIGYFVFGMEPQQIAEMASQQQGAGASQEAGVEGTPEDEAGLFVDVIGANINDVWAGNLNG